MKRLTDIEIINLYDFSSAGVVTNKVTGYVLTGVLNCKGYIRVGVRHNNLQRYIRVHRFVALLHIPNPNDYPHINHKDGNKQNNCVDNLEWCTAKMNSDHARKNGYYNNTIGENNKRAILKDSDVVEIRKRLSNGESFKKVYKDYTQISWWSFREICRGRAWKHISNLEHSN